MTSVQDESLPCNLDESYPDATNTYVQQQTYDDDDEDKAVYADAGDLNLEESVPVYNVNDSSDRQYLKRTREASDDDNDNGNSKHPTIHGNSEVVASHYNALPEKGFDERSKSRIFFMRNFNNYIKSVLILEYLTKIKESSKLGAPLRVLDMCCGKGGDLMKWEKGNITHLICADIAALPVEQCETRYKSIVQRNSDKERGQRSFSKIYSAEFITSDCTRSRLREQYKDPSIELNLVSCQFAFHYSFESLKQAECMIKNAAECLREGGYFIGTMPDANEIMKRQRANGTSTFGNDVYQISFLSDTECPPLFGAKYNFKLEGVVNCPEFLVHFPLFIKLAKKYGLELVAKERFDDFFHRNINNSKSLIERMQGLETYPPGHNQKPAAGDEEEEYEHVRMPENHRKCGTLSKSEWEAISLYLVFGFRKMKKQWDDQGNPIFV